MSSLLIFTDLDGTLLDHHNYGWAPAAAALARLAQRRIPLIFNSSKTCSEILLLRRQLDNHHPFVAENGSAVYVPRGYFDQGRPADEGDLENVFFSRRRDDILRVLEALRDRYGFRFRGFRDMTTDQLAAATGLEPDAAERANQRDCSEPLQWQDSEQALFRFNEALQAEGLRLLSGGRFRHVMGATDKAEGIRWLVRRYRDTWPERDFVTVALGDSPNDLAMLEAADIPVVIEPAAGAPLRLEESKTAIYAGLQGPAGWQRAMDRILDAFPD